MIPTTATVLPVTPSRSDRFTTAAPTPVLMNALAIAYANISMNSAMRILLTLFIALSSESCSLILHTILAIITAYIAARGAAINALTFEIISPARRNTGENFNRTVKNDFINSSFYFFNNTLIS